MAVIIDTIGILLALVALDDFFVLDLFGLTMQGYFRIRKVNGAGYDLIASLSEFLPYVGGALPLKTIGVATVVWIDGHPKGLVAKGVATANVVKKPTSGTATTPKLDGIAKAA